MKNRYSYFWKLCCCFFLLGFYPYGTAQVIVTKSQKQTAAEQILRLKSGTLVIRLSSKYRNIRAIDKALENEQLKSSARKQLEKKRRQILEKQRKLNVEMVRAFAKNYDFSDYRIMYDTATSHLRALQTSGYFLDERLEVQPEISIATDKPIYLLYLGQLSSADANNARGYIISNLQGDILQTPFPYFTRLLHPSLSFFAAFFGRAGSILPRFDKMTRKLNERLKKYYKKSFFRKERDKLKEALEEG